MLTVSADKLSMKRLTAFLAVLSLLTIASPTFRALHQERPPRKAQCMTAAQECQPLLDSENDERLRLALSGFPKAFRRISVNRSSTRVASIRYSYFP
jgi:hypothetical protein